jgi:hypothetical protein
LYKHNAAYSAQTKTAAVIDYRKGLGSLQNICKKHRIRHARTQGAEVHKVYLSATLDLYGRRIVAFVVGEHNDTPLVFRTFE